jgi:hypothetical protein
MIPLIPLPGEADVGNQSYILVIHGQFVSSDSSIVAVLLYSVVIRFVMALFCLRRAGQFHERAENVFHAVFRQLGPRRGDKVGKSILDALGTPRSRLNPRPSTMWRHPWAARASRRECSWGRSSH